MSRGVVFVAVYIGRYEIGSCKALTKPHSVIKLQ